MDPTTVQYTPLSTGYLEVMNHKYHRFLYDAFTCLVAPGQNYTVSNKNGEMVNGPQGKTTALMHSMNIVFANCHLCFMCSAFDRSVLKVYCVKDVSSQRTLSTFF